MAVVVNRLTPGPVGLYVVSVGYFAPALLIIRLFRFAGGHAEHPRRLSSRDTYSIQANFPYYNNGHSDSLDVPVTLTRHS